MASSFFRWSLIALLSLSGGEIALAISYAPPDERSWDEVVATFTLVDPEQPNGERDGSRLKELDPKRAASFIIPFLSKSQPRLLRIKAITACGVGLQECVPALSAIARDPSEEEWLRSQALNFGLRNVQHPDAIRTAIDLVEDKSLQVRRSAYWVLAEHGTDEAVAVLVKRLRAKDLPLTRDLIYTFLTSKRPDASKIVFENCVLKDLPPDALGAYAEVMRTSFFPPAEEAMFSLLPGADWPLQARVLAYFSAFPREDVVPYLIKHIETDRFGKNGTAAETVATFLESPKISAESKGKLRALQAAGKVRTVK